MNLLARLDGESDEKRAWLAHEWPVIEVDSEGDPKAIRSMVVRYYRQYLRDPPEERRFHDHDRKLRRYQRMLEHERDQAEALAELEAEEGHATAHR